MAGFCTSMFKKNKCAKVVNKRASGWLNKSLSSWVHANSVIAQLVARPVTVFGSLWVLFLSLANGLSLRLLMKVI